MNFIILFLSIHFLVFKLVYSGKTFQSCDVVGHEGHWNCISDSTTANITYDCSLNNDSNTKIWLWSKFHDKIHSLTIQNCEKLIIYTSDSFLETEIEHLKEPLKLNFQYLTIRNITNFYQFYNKPSDWKKYVAYDESEEGYNRPTVPYRHYFDCMLKDFLFENIAKAHFSFLFLQRCNLRRVRFRNLTDAYFDNDFYISSSEKVEVTSSRFGFIDKSLNFYGIKEVIIKNNYFKRTYTLDLFKLRAEKIIFIDNEVELLKNHSLLFNCKNTKIANNIFHHINENAFSLISLTDYAANNTYTLGHYNFSNNIIHSLAPGSLNIASQNGRRTYFDHLTIVNNSINCDCANIYWFDSVFPKEKDFQQNRIFKKWSDIRNHNKCLNIKNCFISQVLTNYRTLCEDDYVCSKEIEDKFIVDDSDTRKEDEFPTKPISEMSQNISKLLQSLLERVEKIPFKSFDSKLEEGLSYVNVTHSCVVAITVLFGLLLSYFVIVNCLQISFVKVFILKFGPKTKILVNETEMD